MPGEMTEPGGPTAAAATPLPDLILYRRDGCHLCDDAREVLGALFVERAADGRSVPRLVERDIATNEDWERAFGTAIPVVEVGGVILIVPGLNLAGMLGEPALERAGRLLDAGAAQSVATAGGTVALASPSPRGGSRIGDRLGGRLVSARGGWLASFGLGAIFAIGWTPCIGVILGGILMMAASSATVLQGGIL